MAEAFVRRYGQHAERYRRFRPRYPDWLFDLASEACGDRRGLAAELGAGSGQATAQILERFDRVIAVEPDADMAALIPFDPRLSVQVSPAETAVFPELLDAALAATSFHWMDAERTGRRVAEALRPGGVFLAFSYRPFRVVGPAPVVALVEAEEALWRPHAAPLLFEGWRPYPDLLAQSGAFASIEPIAFEWEEARTPETAAGLLTTASYTAAHARETGDEEGYCEGLRRRVEEAAGGEPVRLLFEVTGGLARTRSGV